MTGVFSLHSIVLYQGCLLGKLFQHQVYDPQLQTLDDVSKLVEDGQRIVDLIHPSYFASELIFNKHYQGPKIERLREAMKLNQVYVYSELTPLSSDELDHVVAITGASQTYHPIGVSDCDFYTIAIPSPQHLGFILSSNMSADRLEYLNNAIMTNIN